MKWTLLVILAAVALLAAFVRRADPEPPAVAAAGNLVSGPGRVEPLSEEIKIGSEIRGRIKALRVEEGDRVTQGQILAILEHDDSAAQCLSAEAQLQQKRAELRRVINGARAQERREAAAAVKEAEAVLDDARAAVERKRGLYRDGVIARDEYDRAVREHGVAQARLEAARQRHHLIEDDAREEDRSRAQAEVALAEARIQEARAFWEKHFIRAPLSGVVLRRHMRVGENITEMREQAIVTVADISTLRVRMDVDENDVGHVRPGQRAYVTAEAFPGQKFWGQVIRVGRLLGRKNVRTEEPAEKNDTKVLETLIELEGGATLPVGLRVDAFVRR
jgi:HlyD family secretion protein